MTRRKDDVYQFPCAVIRGNERTLLGKNDLIRVVEARQFSQAMAVLGEFGYGDGSALENPRDFEKVLREEQKRVSQLVFSILPEEGELSFLQAPADYHNVKVLLKAESLGISAAHMLTAGGSVEPERMAALIRERNFIFLSQTMKDGVQEALDLFARGRDPQEIDIVLDKACYKEMWEGAQATGNEFLMGYVQLLIDILNLNALLRLRRMGKGWDFFRKVFLEGGTISEKLLTANYEESCQQLAERLAPYGFRDVLSRGGGLLEETGKYTLLEKLCDDLRMQYLRDAKYITAGPEPVAAFYLAKESEIKNLRMVFTGRLSGTSEEIMKERLRETYV